MPQASVSCHTYLTPFSITSPIFHMGLSMCVLMCLCFPFKCCEHPFLFNPLYASCHVSLDLLSPILMDMFFVRLYLSDALLDHFSHISCGPVSACIHASLLPFQMPRISFPFQSSVCSLSFPILHPNNGHFLSCLCLSNALLHHFSH